MNKNTKSSSRNNILVHICQDDYQQMIFYLKRYLCDQKNYLKNQQAKLMSDEGLMQSYQYNATHKEQEVIDFCKLKGWNVLQLNKKQKQDIGRHYLSRHVAKIRQDCLELKAILRDNTPLSNGIEQCEYLKLFGSPLTLEELKKGWKKLSSAIHPDRQQPEAREFYTEAQSEVNNLYQTLLDLWSQIDPTNLAIDLATKQKITAKKLSNPILIKLLSK